MGTQGPAPTQHCLKISPKCAPHPLSATLSDHISPAVCWNETDHWGGWQMFAAAHSGGRNMLSGNFPTQSWRGMNMERERQPIILHSYLNMHNWGQNLNCPLPIIFHISEDGINFTKLKSSNLDKSVLLIVCIWAFLNVRQFGKLGNLLGW